MAVLVDIDSISFDGVVFTYDAASGNYLSPQFEGEFFDNGDVKPLPMIVADNSSPGDFSWVPGPPSAYLDYYPNAAVSGDEAWVLLDGVWTPFAFNGGSGGVEGSPIHYFSFPDDALPSYGAAPGAGGPQNRPFTEFDDDADQAELTRSKGFKAEEGFRPGNGFRRMYGFKRVNGF